MAVNGIMHLALVKSRAQSGVEAPCIDIEVHLSGGLPATSIVGLPEAAVREARDRVRAAVLNSRFEYPQRRVTINLAPADIPKDGSRFDLAIALGILAASRQIPDHLLASHEFLGELALSGELRSVTGVLPALLKAKQAGHCIIVPAANESEAMLVQDADVFVARSLLEVCAYLAGKALLEKPQRHAQTERVPLPDLIDIKGQFQARRALEIAAAGAHNLLMIGPPGTGKTMLANRLAGILPPLTEDEALELAAVRSVAGLPLAIDTFRQRPTRSPHHSASAAALIGGGSSPKPGEISLAHHGVLFLDELTEFNRHVLENLREPLESGRIFISRAARQAEFPARAQLIAAMNPCPCGYAGDPRGRCRCSPDRIQRYASGLSGPLLDRIDIHLEVNRLSASELRQADPNTECSQTVQTRVVSTRQLQYRRCGKPNAWLGNREIELHCALKSAEQKLLDQAIEQLGLSARAYHRVLRLARTIADLATAERIGADHLAEALSYRRLDRKIASG